MNAIEVKRQLDKKIDGVAKTIAFCYGENHTKNILDKMENLQYYIYENDDIQITRLKNIGLVDIARSFAFDITSQLKVDDKRRKEIEFKIAKILNYSLDDDQIEKEIRVAFFKPETFFV